MLVLILHRQKDSKVSCQVHYFWKYHVVFEIHEKSSYSTPRIGLGLGGNREPCFMKGACLLSWAASWSWTQKHAAIYRKSCCWRPYLNWALVLNTKMRPGIQEIHKTCMRNVANWGIDLGVIHSGSWVLVSWRGERKMKEYLIDFGLMVFAASFSRKRRTGGMLLAPCNGQ